MSRGFSRWRSVTPTTKTVAAVIGASKGCGLRLASARVPKKRTTAKNSQAAGRFTAAGLGQSGSCARTYAGVRAGRHCAARTWLSHWRASGR
jgi:hypothetical protein